MRSLAAYKAAGNRQLVASVYNELGSALARTGYVCRMAATHRDVCDRRAIEAHILDNAVWRRIVEFLRDPERIADEVEAMRAGEAPGTAAIAAIEGRITKLAKKIENLKRVASYMEDPEASATLAGDIEETVRAKRELEEEKSAALMHYAAWHDTQAGLERVLDWASRVSKNLENLNYDEKRAVLAALNVEVRLYRTSETPRVTLNITLPLSGTTSLPSLKNAHCVNNSSICW